MAIPVPSPCIPDEGVDARIPDTPFSVLTIVEVRNRLKSSSESNQQVTALRIAETLILSAAQVHAALAYYVANQSDFDAELSRREAASEAALEKLFAAHGDTNNFGRIVGTWPGDETDEAVEAALERLS
jgi:hypothetical protein